MTRQDDQRLAEVLASIGPRLRIEGGPPIERAAPGRRRWLAAAAVIVFLAGAAVAIAPVRRTVAGWLGVGSTRVVIDPSIVSAPLPVIADDLPPIDRATAERLVTLPDLGGSDLGAPSAYARMPEGGVLVAWPSGDTLWVHRPVMSVGILFDKLVSAGESVQLVDDLGDGGLVITGDHVLQTPHRTLAAGTTVVWTDDGLELRLEGDRPSADLVTLARQLTPPS